MNHTSGASADAGIGRDGHAHGITWPRLYSLLVFAMTRGRAAAYRSAILDQARIATGDRMLDIGCGAGALALDALGHVLPDGSVTGIDVSEPMLAAARRKARRAGQDIHFRKADAADLPFPDAHFDVVTMVTVMHMVPERDRGENLREIFRVLKPGGRLLLVDYAGDPAGRKGLIAKHGPHGRFDLHALRGPLADEGFRIEAGDRLGWLDLHFLPAVKPRP